MSRTQARSAVRIMALSWSLAATCCDSSGTSATSASSVSGATNGSSAAETWSGSSIESSRAQDSDVGSRALESSAAGTGQQSAGAGTSSADAANTAGTTTQPSNNADDPCSRPGLVWRSANKTNYESYPDPGSPECIEYNGCTWEGLFAACDAKKPEAWVSDHRIVAAFPDFADLQLHDLCLRKGDRSIVVTVLDTCGDSDCDGCCTQNRGSADELIDVEKYTDQAWGVPDGRIEWADLGPTTGTGCD